MTDSQLPFVHLPLQPPSRQDAESDHDFETSQNALNFCSPAFSCRLYSANLGGGHT